MVSAEGISDGRNFVMLELARRASTDTISGNIETNRIGMLAESISISTNKQSVALPIPFSGVIRGEATTINMDMGMASKSITIDGIIVDQLITKNNSTGQITAVKMTGAEIAQLIHSYVDSSALQEDQNPTKLIILYPSRVDGDFIKRSGVSDDDDDRDLPLISFNWGNREYDVPSWTMLETPFSAVVDTTDEIAGVTGFVNSFTTTHAGTDYPQITFNMTFTQASTVLSDFINAST